MTRSLSLAKSVAAAGGIDEWNAQPGLAPLKTMVDAMVTATTAEEAVAQVNAMIALDNYLWAYMYMRKLADKDINLFHKTVAHEPAILLPVLYTPTVGEACQKMGMMPMYERGMYISIKDKGNLAAVIKEYAEAMLPKDAAGNPECQCIVFSDGGRILGLGDLGAWGMGIPIGKLDLYTACAGFDPVKTIPCIIDGGIGDATHNTAKLHISDHALYTGGRHDRVTNRSEAGTIVNTGYYGEDSLINEFLGAVETQFGAGTLCQFEDFNSNDAFPLLAAYRQRYLCYNDDIQGTAAVAVAGILGALKLRNPKSTDLIGKLQQETFLFHGAGSANIGGINLLHHEGGVPLDKLFITNSRGLIWSDGNGGGNFRNAEQAEYAHIGQPAFDSKNLVTVIENIKPTVLVGAVGVAPGCFSKEVIEMMMKVNTESQIGEDDAGHAEDRPVVFALSNPKSQAEVTAHDAYTWSQGKVIYGSGTQFEPVTISGRVHAAGQVNNVYIFPGVSFGAMSCKAKLIPEGLFLKAAEAVANSLSSEDIELDRVIPSRDRLQEVNLNVATAVVLECQKLGIAQKPLGGSAEEVQAALQALQWKPQ